MLSKVHLLGKLRRIANRRDRRWPGERLGCSGAALWQCAVTAGALLLPRGLRDDIERAIAYSASEWDTFVDANRQ